MKFSLWALCALFVQVPLTSRGEAAVAWERNGEGSADARFEFQKVGRPQRNDAGKSAAFSVLSGAIDPNSGGIQTLNDGRTPRDEDVPGMNFFFAAGTGGGRLLVDLGRVISIGEVRSFSWHPGDRGPQVYELYAIEKAPSEPREAERGDLESLGWRQVATVDTRDGKETGGQYGVSIRDSSGKIGEYRYLALDIARTEDNDAFGNTFYSEIDVIETGAVEEKESEAGQALTKDFEFGKYRLTVDTTVAPDLTAWSEEKLVPVIKEWYPKLVEMLPGEGYEAPTRISVRFREDMRGTPASAGGSRINCNADWFRKNLKGEALGAVVHEMAHVVQNYGWGRRNNPNAARTPGWVVEGIPDYIRWFLYEPESKGAEITSRNLSRARYDANYPITGNFFNWVAVKHGQDVIWKINAAARQGRYSPDLWKDFTGKTVEELGETWRSEHEKRLSKNEN